MVYPLVEDEAGRMLTAARLMMGWELVMFLHPDGFVYVQLGNCVAYLWVVQAMRELLDLTREWREMREAWLLCE